MLRMEANWNRERKMRARNVMRRWRQRSGACDQAQGFPVENLYAGTTNDLGADDRAFPIHGEAHHCGAMHMASDGFGRISLEPLHMRRKRCAPSDQRDRVLDWCSGFRTHFRSEGGLSARR